MDVFNLFFELFYDLGATEEQLNFTCIYTIAREGIAKLNLTDQSNDLTPLLDVILEKIPSSSSDELNKQQLRIQPFNLGYDNFMGRLAIGRIYEGTAKTNSNVFVKTPSGETRTGKIAKIFSFSGLKTAVLYAWQKQRFFVSRQKTYYLKAAFAKEIQQAIIDVLIKKTIKAAKDYKVKTIILGGGVSANQELRKQFKKKIEKTVVGNFAGAKFPTTVANKKIEFLVPEPELSTDNGLMIAVAGYFNKKNTVDWKNISANGNLRIGK